MKPLGGIGPGQVPGARFELFGCQAWTEVPASLDLPMDVVFEDETRRDELQRKPLGVIAAIAPWNWPLLIAVRQMIPALRAGNTVVLKPSEYTSIGTLELVRLIAELLPPARPPPAQRLRHRCAPADTANAGTGRQRCGHRAARCRSEADRDGPVLGRLHQHGPDLRLRQATVCARQPARCRGAELKAIAESAPMGERGRWPHGCRLARCGSTSTAPSTRWCLSAAARAPAGAWSSASKG